MTHVAKCYIMLYVLYPNQPLLDTLCRMCLPTKDLGASHCLQSHRMVNRILGIYSMQALKSLVLENDSGTIPEVDHIEGF